MNGDVSDDEAVDVAEDGGAPGATVESEAGEDPIAGQDPPEYIDRFVHRSEQLLQAVEMVAALVLVALFAIGVFDLGLQILGEIRSGDISDPLVVIGFIDTALLLFIIVEVYQTVIAYAQSDDTANILRLVIFTGVIALVRKAIVFRAGEYNTPGDALLVAGSYGLLTLTLALLLFVSYQYVGSEDGEPATY